MSGWIKLYRSMIEWEWYSDINVKVLFLHLLLKANHSDQKWKGIDVKRGQLVTGRKKLSAQTGLSEQSIRTSLDKLKSTNEITIRSTNQNSIITICNYDNYQQKDDINQQGNQRSTNDQPTINQQLTTNKNDKKEENENNINRGHEKNHRSFVADANKDEREYRIYLFNLVKEKQVSRDQLFMKEKIDLERRNELWEDFIRNSLVNVPLIEDDKHAWNTFKKFVQDNSSKYKVGFIKGKINRNPV